MKKYFLIAVLPIFALALTGCHHKATEKAMEREIEKETGGQVDINLNNSGGEIVFEDEETGSKVEIDTSGGLDLPSEWPNDMNLYKDADLISSVTNNDGVNIVMQSDDGKEKVANWYDEEYKDWDQVASMNIGGSFMRTYEKGDKSFAVVINSQNGKTMISNSYLEN